MEQTTRGKRGGARRETAAASWHGVIAALGGWLRRVRSHSFWVHLSRPRTLMHGLMAAIGWLHAVLVKLPWVIVVLVLCIIVIQGLTQHATVIDPISVPRDLADSGYTSEVASHRLRDAVTGFMRGVNSHMSNPDIALHGDLPRVVVPAVGISLDAIVASIRSLVRGTRSRTVSGEIVAQDKQYWLRLRLDGREIYSSKVGAALNKPDDLFVEAVPALLKNIKPYFVAVSLRHQDPEAAMKFIEEILPKLARDDEDLPWFYNQRGLILRARKDYAAAEADLMTAIRLNPGLVASHVNLGEIYADQNKLEAAVAEDRKAVEIEPNFALTHDNYGDHLRMLKRYTEARAEIDRAIALDAKYAPARETLGKLYVDTGRREQAVAAFTEALRLDPKLPTARQELDKLMSAQAAAGAVQQK